MFVIIYNNNNNNNIPTEHTPQCQRLIFPVGSLGTLIINNKSRKRTAQWGRLLVWVGQCWIINILKLINRRILKNDTGGENAIYSLCVFWIQFNVKKSIFEKITWHKEIVEVNIDETIEYKNEEKKGNIKRFTFIIK